MAAPRRPDPEPLPTSDLTVVAIGTALWVVALVVALVLGDRLDDQGRDSWVWITAAGAGLGLVGIRHLRRRRAHSADTSDPSADRSASNRT